MSGKRESMWRARATPDSPGALQYQVGAGDTRDLSSQVWKDYFLRVEDTGEMLESRSIPRR